MKEALILGFNKLLISKRQFNILNFLEQQCDWITIETIANHLNVSNKTIQNDLKKVRNILPEDWTFLTEQGLGVRLIRPVTHTVDSTFQHDESNLFYKLVNLLIQEPQKTIVQINKKLFISSTTTIQLLDEIESYLKNHQLTLKRQPYTIEGHEANIRILLFESHKIRYGFTYDYKQINHLKETIFNHLSKNNHIQLTPYGMETFYTFIEITIERMKKNNHIQMLHSYTMNCLRDSLVFRQLKDIFYTIENYYDVTLSENERLFLSATFTFSDFYLTKMWSIEEFEKAQENQPILSQIIHFIHYLENEFSLPFSNNLNWMNQCGSLYYINLLRNIHPTFFYQSIDPLLQVSQNNYPLNCYAKVNEICIKWAHANNIHFSKYIISSFALLIQQFITKYVKLEVAVVTTRPYCVGQYKMNLLEREFAGKANFTLIELRDIHMLNDIMKQYDYLVTDTFLSGFQPTYPHFFSDLFFNTQDLALLQEEIDQMKLEKELQFISF